MFIFLPVRVLDIGITGDGGSPMSVDLGDVLGPAINAAGQVAGGYIAGQGANSANRTNLRIAQAQMDFQERMSSSAHQREVADLIKAGLNPAMAYRSAGASTPMGASARMDNELAAVGSGVANASSMARNVVDMQAARADVAQKRANVKLTETEAKFKEAEIIQMLELRNAQTRFAAQGALSGQTKNMIDMQTLKWLRETYGDRVASVMLSNQLTGAQVGATHASAENMRLTGKIMGPEAEAASSWWKRNVSPYISDVGSAVRMFGSLVPYGRIGSAAFKTGQKFPSKR